jgi:predicted branched-subunit amino acid permease
VYGGAAQLASTVLWADGAPLLVAALTGLVANARFFIYSASLAPVLRPRGAPAAIGLGYLIRDGGYAITMTRGRETFPDAIVPYYVGATLTDWTMWLAATTGGVFGAALVPARLSLDFVVPLVFLALLAGALKERGDVGVAIVTAVAAAVFVPLLPLQTGILAAIATGMAWTLATDGGDPTTGARRGKASP